MKTMTDLRQTIENRAIKHEGKKICIFQNCKIVERKSDTKQMDFLLK